MAYLRPDQPPNEPKDYARMVWRFLLVVIVLGVLLWGIVAIFH